MKLEKFSKNKKQKKIIIGSVVGLILIIGGITLYRTFALYEEKKEFNVLKGKVGDFRKTQKDIEIAAIVNGEKSDTIPTKEEGYIVEEVNCTNGAEAIWNNEDWTITIKKLTTSGTTCSLNFYPKQFNDFVIAKSRGNEQIEEFEHEATEQTPALTDYRYVGSNPNNFVCFGSEEETCPDENLYRIIGVIPTQKEVNGVYEIRVKLIKASFYTENKSGYLIENTTAFSGRGYRYNNDLQNNNWEISTLNTKVLNSIYWNSLGNFQNYISLNVWYLGALAYANDYTNQLSKTYTPNDFYEKERSNTPGKSSINTHLKTNIGLIYPSDYSFSIGKKYQNEVLFNNCQLYTKNSWLYQLENKYYEWTITPEAVSYNYSAWGIVNEGWIFGNYQVNHDNYVFSIRPTFYLKSNVQYKSGNGTIENPYRITID